MIVGLIGWSKCRLGGGVIPITGSPSQSRFLIRNPRVSSRLVRSRHLVTYPRQSSHRYEMSAWNKNPAFVGLISMVTGSTLREDIAATTRQLLLKGQNILGLTAPGNNPGVLELMIDKRPIRPERLRQIPSGFSWVDHRLIREHRLEGCAHGAWALYLFLVTVSDVQGLSYYSEAAFKPSSEKWTCPP